MFITDRQTDEMKQLEDRIRRVEDKYFRTKDPYKRNYLHNHLMDLRKQYLKMEQELVWGGSYY